MVIGLIQGFLGIDELKRQVDELKGEVVALEGQVAGIDQRVETIELQIMTVKDQADSMLNQFGDYKNRASEELKLMAGQIADLLDSVDALDNRMEDEKKTERTRTLTRQMRSRLKNNQTRIAKELDARTRVQGA